MQFNEFLDQVVDQMKPASQEEALILIQATLETLGERVYRSIRTDLAAQLPDELKKFLMARVVPETTPNQVDRFPLYEFYQRVSARADMSLPQAKRGAQVVMKVLKGAVTTGQWQELSNELPPEYNKILHKS